MDDKLKEILKLYIKDFNDKSNNPEIKKFIVENSIPIVWFGDLDKYLDPNNKRVVTIGLNPSLEEFSEKRFEYIDFRNELTEDKLLKLNNTLNNYFYFNPYWKWFSWGERALNAIDASYNTTKSNCSNSALHIDIYSAIATNPTWGNLNANIKNQLSSTNLYEKLLDYLNPEIILVSVNKDIFSQMFKDYILDSENYEKTNNKGFYIRKYHKGNKRLIWVFNNRGTAFGVSNSFLMSCISNI